MMWKAGKNDVFYSTYFGACFFELPPINGFHLGRVCDGLAIPSLRLDWGYGDAIRWVGDGVKPSQLGGPP